MEKRYDVLQKLVQEKLSYAAHDLDHVLRVYHLCILLARHEQNVDLDVLIPAVLLHDIARAKEDEDISGEIDHAVLGAKMAETILLDLNYDGELISKICQCILTHRFRSGNPPKSIEAKILYDADKLDIIGATGIARSFMLAGQHGERLYTDVSIDDYIRENIGENGRIKDPSKHTTYIEFELKLKKLPDRLFTDEAKKIAEQRIAYMSQFFETLKQEITGDI
ncbi:HD domain-containing protein [Dehalobacter sp. DCM]|uniref:HD domain-containing protein n=1 Tax=Dehalobacter sp. DCM TaxID=2907827 RepID=UPI003081D0EC|nr:HD domain-containing protein [Dehalobacter sp. DCM]